MSDVLRFAPVRSRMRAAPASSSTIAIEAALCGPIDGETIMAIIGSFTKTEAGFQGRIHMLNVDAKARLVPTDTTNDKAPDFRILAGPAEIGAAWRRTSEAGRDYISVKLDDPTFQRPVYASLVEAEEGEGFNLIWSRPSVN